MFGTIFVKRINMWEYILISIFVILGLGSWLFIMSELLKNIVRRLKERKK
jgi:hypothetical protein